LPSQLLAIVAVTLLQQVVEVGVAVLQSGESPMQAIVAVGVTVGVLVGIEVGEADEAVEVGVLPPAGRS
jgi:hypothetical protein